MSNPDIKKLVQSFKNMNVLVLGDVMIDAYYWGNVERISPEAPVPIVNVNKTEDRLGGAANVALNLIAFNANAIICTVIGKDRRGEDLMNLMHTSGLNNSGVVQSSLRRTTVKTRIISNHQQMLRVDEEQTNLISNEDEVKLIEVVNKIIDSQKIDVIIFEDYNKGVLSEKVIQSVIQLAKQKSIPTCVDPKSLNFFTYVGVTLFKPNLKELREGLKIEINKNNIQEINTAAEKLESKLNHSISLITLSENGVFVKDKNSFAVFPAHIRNISDVSGAGDTVIAVAALCLASGIEPEFIARLSNLAGGLVCEKVGVVPIDREQFIIEAENEFKN